MKQTADFYEDSIGLNFEVLEPPLNIKIFCSNFAKIFFHKKKSSKRVRRKVILI